MNIKIIITGATGMVGEGVLHECLKHDEVTQVLVINRKPCNTIHPKLKEVIHTDFFDLSSIESEVGNYDACFFCLGVSSIGMSEEKFTRFTHTLTMHVATTLVKHNSLMTFCYISGTGTDSSEKGKIMWSRVKGKTENDLMKLPFKKVYAFRPGFLKPTKGLHNALKLYKYLTWLYPLFRMIFPKYVSTLKELGLAMINVTLKGYGKTVLEVKDIVRLARQ